MREVIVTQSVWDKIADFRVYLSVELKLSEEAAMRRTDRMGAFLKRLANHGDYALCRFSRWRKLGYHCAPFDKCWVFAYEIVPDGIIVRDMAHGAALHDE